MIQGEYKYRGIAYQFYKENGMQLVRDECGRTWTIAGDTYNEKVRKQLKFIQDTMHNGSKFVVGKRYACKDMQGRTCLDPTRQWEVLKRTVQKVTCKALVIGGVKTFNIQWDQDGNEYFIDWSYGHKTGRSFSSKDLYE